MRRRYLVANWKMNLPTDGVDSYLRQLTTLERSDAELVIAPPFPFLVPAQSLLSTLGLKASLAAQNCSDREGGPFTGEVSAPMLAGIGVRYVILGHSERRMVFGESDDLVGRKLTVATSSGLIPMFCVGEEESAHLRGETNQVLERQLNVGLRDFPRSKPLVVAYEPVWAIGTGQNATPQVAASAHAFIRGGLARLGFAAETSILYGGSVSPENAEELASERQVDGFLVGGASLEASKFRMIYERLMRARAKDSRAG